MIQKHFYEAPEAEILSVKFERNFLDSDGNGLEDGTGIPFGAPNRNDYHG